MKILAHPASPRLLHAVKLAAVLGLLALLWHVADGPAALDLLQQADPRWIAAAVVALSVQTLLSAQRWRITAAQLGLRLGVLTALREYYLAQALNQSLPGGVLGDAGRALRTREEAGLLVAGQAVLFERLAGQIGLIAVVMLGLLGALVVPVDVAWPAGLGATLVTVLLCLVLCFVLTGVALRSPGLRDRAVSRFAKAFAHALAAPEVRFRQALLSLGTALCNVAAFAFCAAAIGAPLSIVATALIVPLILFAMLLPLSIGGWGLREGAAAALLPTLGAAASEGLAASVAFGLSFLLATLPGLLLYGRRPSAREPGRTDHLPSALGYRPAAYPGDSRDPHERVAAHAGEAEGPNL